MLVVSRKFLKSTRAKKVRFWDFNKHFSQHIQTLNVRTPTKQLRCLCLLLYTVTRWALV